jgi:hypothetical protein
MDNNMNASWQLPEVFIAQYLAACKLASLDDKAFANFRQDPHISCIIENTTKEHADKMLIAMQYDELLAGALISVYTPTQVRYQYIKHLINKLIENNCETFCEIGPGYGGLIEALHDQSECQTFHMFDLPEPQALQEKYLSKVHGAESLWPYLRWHDLKTPDFVRADLCISWCAWSELSKPLREEYAEKVISKCDHFFICSNYNKQEDMEILSKYFTGIKEYSDDIFQNIIYC